MTDESMTVSSSGRPRSDRDGPCICDYNPDTTDGPEEDCPFHGRPYGYWVERGDDLTARLAVLERQLAAARSALAACADVRAARAAGKL